MRATGRTSRSLATTWLIATALLALVLTGCGRSAQTPRPPEQAVLPTGQAQREEPARPTAPPPAALPPVAHPLALTSQPGPLQGTLEVGKSYAVATSGQNTHVQLTIADLQIATAAGDSPAPPGQRYVVLSAIWKNVVPPQTVQRPKPGGRSDVVGGSQEMETVIVETPYMVPTLADHLYLLLDGRYVAEISPASERLPDHLPLTGLLVKYNAEIRGTVAFAIPSGASQSLTLVFFDFTQGHITLPLYGSAPAAQDSPAVGPARNGLFEAAVYRTEFTRKVGQAEAPAGQQYLVVGFGASSVAPGAATQLDFSQYVYLIEDDVYQVQPVENLANVALLFQGLVRFIPGFVRHGVIVFEVPEQTGRMELLLAASQMDPLSFILTPTVQARPQPQPVRVIQDGNSAEVLINSATWTDRVGNMAAEEGRRFLVLDITVVNKEASQGLTLEPRQFALTDGRAVYEASTAKQKLAHPLVGERVIPAGKKGRFEIAIEAPKDARGLRLRYSGFTKIEEVPLP